MQKRSEFSWVVSLIHLILYETSHDRLFLFFAAVWFGSSVYNFIKENYTFKDQKYKLVISFSNEASRDAMEEIVRGAFELIKPSQKKKETKSSDGKKT